MIDDCIEAPRWSSQSGMKKAERRWLFHALLTRPQNQISLFLPARYLQNNFETLLPPSEDFRYVLLGFVAANIVLCVVLEDGFMEYAVFRGLRKQ